MLNGYASLSMCAPQGIAQGYNLLAKVFFARKSSAINQVDITYDDSTDFDPHQQQNPCRILATLTSRINRQNSPRKFYIVHRGMTTSAITSELQSVRAHDDSLDQMVPLQGAQQ